MCSIFRTANTTIPKAMNANASGIYIILANEKPDPADDVTITISKEETIVAGVENFFMPKYIGTSAAPAVARLNIKRLPIPAV